MDALNGEKGPDRHSSKFVLHLLKKVHFKWLQLPAQPQPQQNFEISRGVHERRGLMFSPDRRNFIQSMSFLGSRAVTNAVPTEVRKRFTYTFSAEPLRQRPGRCYELPPPNVPRVEEPRRVGGRIEWTEEDARRDRERSYQQRAPPPLVRESHLDSPRSPRRYPDTKSRDEHVRRSVAAEFRRSRGPDDDRQRPSRSLPSGYVESTRSRSYGRSGGLRAPPPNEAAGPRHYREV